MDLNGLIDTYPNIRLFSADDTDGIAQLYEKSPMTVGGMNLVYERTPHFQSLLQAQGDEQLTLVGRGKNNAMLGLSSLSVATRFVNGLSCRVAYLSDLRTNGSLEAAKTWRRFYPDFLEFVRSKNADVCLTTVLQENHVAVQNLASSQRYAFRYDPVARLSMVNVFAQKPLPFSGPRVRYVHPHEEEHLLDFIAVGSPRQQFSYDVTRDHDKEWERRKVLWPNFSVDRFLVAEDAAGRWLGVTLPWDPGDFKRMRASHIPRHWHVGLKFLKLARGHAPQEGEPLSVLYLTHLLCTQEHQGAVTAAFLNHLAKEKVWRQHAFVSLSVAEASTKQHLRAFFTNEVAVGLYNVCRAEQAPFAFDPLRVNFEMALV